MIVQTFACECVCACAQKFCLSRPYVLIPFAAIPSLAHIHARALPYNWHAHMHKLLHTHHLARIFLRFSSPSPLHQPLLHTPSSPTPGRAGGRAS